MNLKKNLIMETRVNTKQKLYNIYFDYLGDAKPPKYICTTNNLDRWLKENNENRPYDEAPEKLDDFIIEDCELYFYEEKTK